MSSEFAINVQNLSKCYEIYEQPHDRLKQFVLPRLRQLLGLAPKQYFREFWALKAVSFDVKKGETIGIVGKNGSGKSTLLQMICGTLNLTQGNITTHGRIAALLELGSGFNPEFTGRENIYMNAAVLGLKREEIDARFEEIAAFADIGQFIEQPTKTYSSGMVLRLAFAVAVNVEPEILVVDEALAVGDELFQRKCFARLEKIRAKGATVLFVSHSGAQVIELCERAILLDGGEMIMAGDAKEVVRNYQKLLYAPQANRQTIRDAMVNKTASKDEFRLHSEKQIHESLLEETFDPYLLPTSTFEYESHGPVIGTPCILTMDGRQVNGLLRGGLYRYCYEVDFQRGATAVRFGMSIKTTTGMSLGGAMTHSGLSSALPLVEAGKKAKVEFAFTCNLNSGVYFMNAGVFGVADGEDGVLHRLTDIIAFRVLPSFEDTQTGTVSFTTKPKVELA